MEFGGDFVMARGSKLESKSLRIYTRVRRRGVPYFAVHGRNFVPLFYYGVLEI
jgi:hypothetical protein